MCFSQGQTNPAKGLKRNAEKGKQAAYAYSNTAQSTRFHAKKNFRALFVTQSPGGLHVTIPESRVQYVSSFNQKIPAFGQTLRTTMVAS